MYNYQVSLSVEIQVVCLVYYILYSTKSVLAINKIFFFWDGIFSMHENIHNFAFETLNEVTFLELHHLKANRKTINSIKDISHHVKIICSKLKSTKMLLSDLLFIW